jgi:hypothetical protein
LYATSSGQRIREVHKFCYINMFYLLLLTLCC